MDEKNINNFDKLDDVKMNNYNDIPLDDTKNDINVGESAPWVIYVNGIRSIFADDKLIHVHYSDDDPYRVKIFADTLNKAYALEHALPSGIDFGNVTLTIEIIPANVQDDPSQWLDMLFEGNPIVKEIIRIQPEGTSNPFTYVSFRNEVIQFWGDNLGDPHGNISTLAEDIASGLFADMDGVYFCTAPKTE